MADLMEVGITFTSKGDKEVIRDLKNVERATEKVTSTSRAYAGQNNQTASSLKKSSDANHIASRQTNAYGMAMQQTGYQVGDFIVQVQSGTNAFVAFGQQATQLVGILPMLAGQFGLSVNKLIGISAGLGIVIPLATALGAAFMRAGGQSETFEDKVKNLDEAISALSDVNDRATMSTSDLRKEYGSASTELQSTLDLLRNIARTEAQDAIDNLSDAISDLYRPRGSGERRTALAELFDVNIFLAFTDAQRDAREEARSLTAEFVRQQTTLSQSKGDLDAQISATQTMLNLARELSALDGKETDDERALIKLLAERLLQMQELQVATEGVSETHMQTVTHMMQIATLQNEINAGAQEIISNRDAELQIQQDRIALAQAELTYGKDSTEYKNTQLAIEERIFKEQLAQNGILGNNAEEILKAYRRANNLEITVDNASNAAENLASGIGDAATNALKLAGIDITSGVNSAAAAAEALAIRLGASVDAALALINIESGMKQQSGPRRESGRTLPQVTRNVPGSLGETYRRSMGIGEFARGTTGGGGGGAGVDPAEEFRKAKDAVDQLRASYDEQYATSLKVQEAQEKINKAMELGVYTKEQGKEALDDYIASLEQAESPMQKLANTARDALGDAFMSIVDGTKSAKDAFADMARIILKQAFELLVIKPILDGIFGGITGGGGGGILKLFGFADGGEFRSGNVIPFANGGIVGSPTMFPMAGNQTGLMGEAGPEAIMPLKRGKGGKLGVVAEGASQPVVIHQNFNFSANGDDSVKRIIAQEAPKIANLTQKQILDQRSRGGVFKTTFG